MILSRDIILKEINLGRIKIAPFVKNHIGPASIDLTLDNQFRIFNNNEVVHLNETSDYKKHSKLIKKKSIVLSPGEYILGITMEKIRLPNDICGILTGRSRYARFGLSIHVTASLVHPGVNNKQILEIKNLAPFSTVLKAGMRICQLILLRTEGSANYKGHFKNQEGL